MSATAREHRLTHGPVLPVLVSMALPNMLAMSAAAAVWTSRWDRSATQPLSPRLKPS
jgi:hypothetical protein